jgi:lambda family phage minor tail protein L
MTEAIIALDEGLNPGAVVELYIVDLTPIGIATQLYFQSSSPLGTSLWFGGKEYVSRGILITGFERSSQDVPPEPTLLISNVDKGGYALLETYGELLGAKITRMQTYDVFLDRLADGITVNPMRDSTAMHFPEIWYIEQKEGSDNETIKFRLKSILDLNGKKVPNRLVLKDFCGRRYRVWNAATASFKYASVCACPYTGSTYFKRDGTVTTNPALDDCTKDFKGCVLRFPNDDLPGWFFPGVSRIPRR